MTARALIIEDNPANLELMRYLLSAFGHVVESATDGESGIAMARRDVPDIIICDVQLPGMSGLDVAKALKLDPALMRVPLIAVTAFAMKGDDQKLLKGGFDGYISKPIDPEQFSAQIDTFLPPDKRSKPSGASAEPSASLAQARRNGVTILAVDNLQANLDFTSSMLEPLGYTVVTATSMREALARLRQVLPDLILSDVCMPGPGGYELIAEVKKDPRLRAIPFVFVTSTLIDASAAQKGIELGAAKYLVRPIEPRKLLAELEACLEQARASRS